MCEKFDFRRSRIFHGFICNVDLLGCVEHSFIFDQHRVGRDVELVIRLVVDWIAAHHTDQPWRLFNANIEYERFRITHRLVCAIDRLEYDGVVDQLDSRCEYIRIEFDFDSFGIRFYWINKSAQNTVFVWIIDSVNL